MVTLFSLARSPAAKATVHELDEQEMKIPEH